MEYCTIWLPRQLDVEYNDKLWLTLSAPVAVSTHPASCLLYGVEMDAVGALKRTYPHVCSNPISPVRKLKFDLWNEVES